MTCKCAASYCCQTEQRLRCCYRLGEPQLLERHLYFLYRVPQPLSSNRPHSNRQSDAVNVARWGGSGACPVRLPTRRCCSCGGRCPRGGSSAGVNKRTACFSVCVPVSGGTADRGGVAKDSGQPQGAEAGLHGARVLCPRPHPPQDRAGSGRPCPRRSEVPLSGSAPSVAACPDCTDRAPRRHPPKVVYQVRNNLRVAPARTDPRLPAESPPVSMLHGRPWAQARL